MKTDKTPEKMTDRIVRRAAEKYRNWLLSKVLCDKQNTSERIAALTTRVMDKSQKMHKWSNVLLLSSHGQERIFGEESYKTIVKCLIPDVAEDIRVSVNQLVSLLEGLVDPSIISETEAIQEIEAIVHSWKHVKYSDGALSVLIPKISLSDENETVFLGSFWIEVNINSPINGLRIASVDEIVSEKGYYHPHVSGEELCTGEGGDLLKDAISQGRLEDYFRIVEAILKTYNEDSPHDALSEWYNPNREGRFLCDVCEEWRNNENSLYCEGCSTQYCEYCSSEGACCFECGEWHCGECCKKCNICEEAICRNCGTPCPHCNNISCSNCLVACACCEESSCQECSYSCVACIDSICEGCLVYCGCCEDSYCSNCIDNTCTDCNKKLCKDCCNTCNDCYTTLCTNCKGHNSCENCGVEVCASCGTEHNCVLKGVNDQ